jgi:hypothetical protein
MFHPTIENEILIAATALWRAGTNGDYYKVFLSEGDFDRLLEEFGEPPGVLTFTRFTIEVQSMRSDETFVLGDSSFIYLKQPLRLVELSLAPEISES